MVQWSGCSDHRPQPGPGAPWTCSVQGHLIGNPWPLAALGRRPLRLGPRPQVQTLSPLSCSAQVVRKVKSMQVFHTPVGSAVQGDRLAICVTQFDPKLLERGLVCAPESLHTVHAALISVEKIPYFRGPLQTKAKKRGPAFSALLRSHEGQAHRASIAAPLALAVATFTPPRPCPQSSISRSISTLYVFH